MSDDTLVAALARAQANFAKIGKGQENKHFSSKYADIADVLAVVRPVLAAEGIAITQSVRITADPNGEKSAELVTALLKGTERLESEFPMPTSMKPQDTLGWLTYMRRGMLCALVGVAPEGEDDDGNTANAATHRYKPRERATAQEMDARPSRPVEDGGKPASDAQVRFLEDLSTQQGWSVEERALVFKKLAGIISDPITKATASALIPELKRIAKKELVVVWNDDGDPVIDTPENHAAAGTEAF